MKKLEEQEQVDFADELKKPKHIAHGWGMHMAYLKAGWYTEEDLKNCLRVLDDSEVSQSGC